MTTQQLTIGDRVRVNNPELASHGQLGTVLDIDTELSDSDWPIDVRIDGGKFMSEVFPFDFNELELISGERA